MYKMDTVTNTKTLVDMGDEIMGKLGYHAHYIIDISEENMTDVHTHGFPATYNKPNIQIVLDIGPRTASILFDAVNKKYSEGVTFEEGIKYYDIHRACPVKFIKCQKKKDSEMLLRMIFADENGVFPGDGAVSNKVYVKQLTFKNIL